MKKLAANKAYKLSLMSGMCARAAGLLAVLSTRWHWLRIPAAILLFTDLYYLVISARIMLKNRNDR